MDGEQSIAALYDRIESGQESREDLDRLFQKIVELGFDVLAQKIADERGYDLADGEDLAALRALYEHGLYLWEEGEFEKASQLFGALADRVEDEKLRKSLRLSALLSKEKKGLEEFVERFVDRGRLDGVFFYVLDEAADNYLKRAG